MGVSSDDPGDSRRFLRKEGWKLVDESKYRERWVGYYENGDTKMKGGIVRKASGTRNFYVKAPTRRFWKNAHSGGCFLKPSNTVDNAYEVHFEVTPDAAVDGIRKIEKLL